MTDLIRILELLGTHRAIHIGLTRYDVATAPLDMLRSHAPLSAGALFVLQITELKGAGVAIGSADTLEEAAQKLLQSCLRVGLLEEPCPRTEPNPEVSHG